MINNIKKMINNNVDFKNKMNVLMETKSWPFEEAMKIKEKINGKLPDKGYVLFETGYGPSGLPHIGTFGEVFRTIMVMNAFKKICDFKTRLFTYSDDMDGLRKVPENVPQREMLKEHLGKPLTNIPDPYEKFESFGAHNNAMLRSFLDSFAFEYEFQSGTEHYKNGSSNEILKKVLENYEEIMKIMLPTLRDERRETYSPILPISPKTGIVLQVKILEYDAKNGTVLFLDNSNNDKKTELEIWNGNAKLQWKVDWGSRWKRLGVDYEMSGKDLIPSVELAKKICKVLGGEPPICLTYELFLDELRQKISKSKGNGLSINDWLKYAPQESLAYYMFQSPKKAKRLYFDVIPRATDEYLNALSKFHLNNSITNNSPLNLSDEEKTLTNNLIEEKIFKEQIENPVFHIHNGMPPKFEEGLSFSILLNLASVCGTEDENLMWGFIKKYIQKSKNKDEMPFLQKLVKFSLKYYEDFVKPNLKFKEPNEEEKIILKDFLNELKNLKDGANEEEIQEMIFEVGKRYKLNSLKDWFLLLYEVILGSPFGPRMGTFISLYGKENVINLIERKIL